MRRIALALSLGCLLLFSGCEVTLSAFVQKDWNTDPHIYHDNDLQSKVELKVTKRFGIDDPARKKP